MKKTYSFTVDDIAAWHAQKRVAIISIDHQMYFQRDIRHQESHQDSFNRFNDDYEDALAMFRSLSMPIIHVISDTLNAEHLEELSPGARNELLQSAQYFLRDTRSMTVRKATAQTVADKHHELIAVDTLHTILPDEIVFTKFAIGAHDNSLVLHELLQEKNIICPIHMGQYRTYCVRSTMDGAVAHGYHVVGLGDLIEDKIMSASRHDRLYANHVLFREVLPTALITDTRQMQKAIIRNMLGPYYKVA